MRPCTRGALTVGGRVTEHDHAADLRRALRAGDGLAARHLREGVDPDERWAVLAQEGASGSVLAVELLVEELDRSGTVRRLVRRSLLDESAVDDVVQDTFVSVAGSIGQFGGDAKVTTWVHRIAQRRVVDHLRRQRTTAELTDSDLGPSARISSMIAARVTVRDAVERLPELYREPVLLRDLAGLDYATIAERLGRSVGTVKSQIARGRAMVAALVGEPG
ncbi:RNA polymerase sigma factor [Miniimonas arenae]|uniref:RNA polymerase sigma factor n=1 Tax=Miniimonas arenae TaxID=676201 RepID=A0A5C5BER4_9MICO|nr:RNA polymerase sigma factor [Miniimonas arenae]